MKALFADAPFAARTQLTAVNSINFARIMAQCVYYFTAAAALAGSERAPSFVVPTGNFGDVFAGEAAARMGLPIDRLVIATNANDILVRALTSGVYSAGHAQQTFRRRWTSRSPAISSAPLFEAANRDGSFVSKAMQEFAATRSAHDPEAGLGRASAPLSRRERQRCRNASGDRARPQGVGHGVDPHTAVGVAAADQAWRSKGPVILLATAHPAKFPEAITQAIGIAPEIPPKLAGLMSQEERYTVLPNEVGAVRTFVLERTGTS